VPLSNTTVAAYTSQPGDNNEERTGDDGAGGLNDLVTNQDSVILTPTVPVLDAFKRGILRIDSDSDGAISPDDTLRYTATLTKTANGVVSEIAGPIRFEVVPLHEPTLQGASPDEIIAFRKEMEALQGQMASFSNQMEKLMDKVEAMETALARADRPSNDLVTRLHEARQTLQALDRAVRGYRSKSEVGERNPPSPQSRLFVGFRGLNTTYGPTEMHKATVAIGKAEMDAVWCEWIPDDGWPCRACVGTSLAPGDLVEIKVTAVKGMDNR